MGLFSKVADVFRKPAEDQAQSWVWTDQGMMDKSWSIGWWQEDKRPRHYGHNATVEACVLAYAHAMAMCPIHVIEDQDNGEEKKITGTNTERVLNNPNPYQTRLLFMVDMVRSVFYEGNAYAVATRDDRNTISRLDLMNPRNTRGILEPESQFIFYYANPKMNTPNFDVMSDESRVFMSRDVAHLRVQTGNDNLVGVSPLQYALNSSQANSAIVGHQGAFFTNQTRPSGIISTDQVLTPEQMAQLQERWDQKSKGINSGGVPILSGGLKFQPMSLSSEDAQLVESYKLTVADISRVFRVPLPLINDMTGATYNNTAMLMSHFLSYGLGFMMALVEAELSKLFGLSERNRRLKFDVSVLLRMDMESKAKAYGQLVNDKIMSLDEARKPFGLAPVQGGYGALPIVQMQDVPIDHWDNLNEQPEPTPTADDIERSILQAMGGG